MQAVTRLIVMNIAIWLELEYGANRPELDGPSHRVGRPVTRSRNKDIPLARGYMSCTRVPIVFLFFN
jgi:hypothetical protein